MFDIDILPAMHMYEAPERSRPLVERLLDGLDAHIRAEEASIQEYRQFAAAAPDPQVALVMRMIVEDEERHHSLLRRILASLNDDIMWSHSPEALPEATRPQRDETRSALQVTKAFLEEERAGARTLKIFASTSRDLHGGVIQLLLDWMALDSQKHERALRFMQARLESER